jgi:O-antigen/teichoic acid export membrane protein
MSFLLKATGGSALAQAIGAVQSILFVPLFLNAWGTIGYGRWLAVTAVVSHLSLMDFGGQSYVGNLLATHHAGHDVETFRRTLGEAVSVFLAISCAAFMLLVGVILLAPAFGAFPTILRSEKQIIVCLAASTLLAIPGGVYVSSYRSVNLFTHGVMIGNALRVVGYGTLGLLLYVGVTPVTYAVVNLVVAILATATVVWDTQRHIPGTRGLGLSVPAALRGLRKLGTGSLYFWTITLAQVANQQGVLLVLATFSSPVAVVVYSTHRTLATIASYVGTLVQAPVWPELTRMWARGARAEVAWAAVAAVKWIVLITGFLAIGVFLAAPIVYPLWTRQEVQLRPALLGLLLAQAVVAAGWVTSGWILLSTSHHRGLALCSMANGALTVVLAALMAKPYGAVGVVLASIVGDIIFGLAFVPRLASSLLNVRTALIYREMSLVVAGVAVAAVCAYGLQRSLGAPWALLVVAVTGFTMVLFMAPAALRGRAWAHVRAFPGSLYLA